MFSDTSMTDFQAPEEASNPPERTFNSPKKYEDFLIKFCFFIRHFFLPGSGSGSQKVVALYDIFKF